MKRQRTIPFASGRHLGTLYHRDPSTTWSGSAEWWPFNSNEEVHGPVSVPADAQVRLWASQKADNRWERIPASFEGLRDLAPDDLDSLCVLTPDPGWANDIAHLTGLSELSAEGWEELSEGELRRLLGLQQLIGLDLGYSEIQRSHLARLIAANPNLRFLNAGGSNVGDASADAIASRPLEWLDLGNSHITDAGLRRLGGLTDLRFLKLNECAVGDPGMGAMAGMTALRHLTLEHTEVTDAGLAPVVGRLRHLEYLSFHRTSVGDGTVASLACPGLQQLSLGDTTVTGATLDPDLLGQLRYLGLLSAPLTREGMERISRLPALQYLSLMGTPIDDAALAKLNGHPTLERIELMDVPVSPRVVLDLIESLPNLKRLGRGLFGNFTTPEAIAEYAAKLRTAPANARTVNFEDLEPVPGRADTMQGRWTNLGRIVDDEWRHPRVFVYDHFGRLWVGCSDRTGSRRDPEPEAWQSPDWWPEGLSPTVLGNVRGAFGLGPDLKVWIGAGGLWSYNMFARQRVRQERPQTSGQYVDIAFDRSDRPWVIRSYDLVWRATRRGWKQVPTPELPANTGMHSIAGHPDGSMWIGCTQGLLRWHRGTWTSWLGPADGLPESYGIDSWAPSKVTSMNAVVVAADGAVWASGGTGVIRYRDGGFTRWDHRDGIPPFWRGMVADPTTRDVYGIGHHHICRFDGERWAVVEVPAEYRTWVHRGIGCAQAQDGRLFVLMEGAQFLRFEPDDLVERQAEATSSPRRWWRFRARDRAAVRR